MKKFPPKERPTWCTLRPLSWDELVKSTDVPLWLEVKGFEHLNQWCLVDIDEVTGKVSLVMRKYIYDPQGNYGVECMAYSPIPKD